MSDQISKPKHFINLFLPSGIELVISTSLALLVMVLYQFGSIQQYLGLPRDIEFGKVVRDTLDVTLNSVLGHGRTETFVVGFFWAIVGLGVYIFLRGIAKALFDLGESIDERGYVWPKGTNRYRPLETVLERVSFQFVVLIVILFWLLQPIARVLDGPVLVGFVGGGKALQYVVWFVMTLLVFHVLTVLTRLFALRERLLG